MMSVNVKLDVNGCQEDYISKLQNSLAQFMSSGTAKTKSAILVFLYCGKFVKNSIENYHEILGYTEWSLV